MPSTLKIDIRDGARITLDRNGYRMDRVALLITDGGETAVQALKTAIDDSLLPALGDEHPNITGVYLQGMTCESKSKGKYLVNMNYADDPGFPGTLNNGLRVSAVTAQDVTGTDNAGNAMSTVYQTQNDIDNSWFSYEFFTADIERPRATFSFEYTVSGVFPKSIIDTYLGNLNAIIWNGYAAKTVLCSEVNINQQGDDWLVSIVFIYNPSGWEYTAQIATPIEQVVNWTDVNLDTSTGRKTFDIYSEVDFSPLGLTL